MNATTKSIASVLNSLIHTCKDGERGFRAAAEDVKNFDMKVLFNELSTQRRQFAAELQSLVASLDEEPVTSGTLGASLLRGWMDVKAAVTNGDEHAILVECEREEDAAVAEYREALKHDDLPADVRGVIRQQSMSVQATHDRVRDLRDCLKK